MSRSSIVKGNFMKNGQFSGWVEQTSVSGAPYSTWGRPVPKIPNDWLDLAFYLYASESEAKSGHHTGGSGFFVGYPSSDGHVRNLYAVTNAHVIRGGFTVFRINKQSGDGYEINPTIKTDWYEHQGGDDLAVCPIRLPLEYYNFRLLSTELFVTEEKAKKLAIGAGDDVVMVGRFTGHPGQQQNIPIARFGNIAMCPTEPTMNGLGNQRNHYLVEVRSLSGFSGSPVLVYDLPFSISTDRQPAAFQQLLLGVDCGHLPEKEKYISAGIAAVIPAWRLLELLNQKELVEIRENWERECTRIEAAKTKIIPDTAQNLN
jgi:hypothetical protein